MQCFRCGSTGVDFRKTIMQNGEIHIAAYCLACGRIATKDAYIPKKRFTAAHIASMTIENDYSDGDLVCCVDGCSNSDVEWHHFAPRGLFGDTAEKWPKGWVCRKHHREWHERTRTGAFAL